MKSRIAKRSFVFAALVALVACGGDSGTTPEPVNPNSASIAGVWHLRSYAGSPLPYVVQNGGTTTSLNKLTFTITEDGKWSSTREGNLTMPGAPFPSGTASTAQGDWSRAGTSITLVANENGLGGAPSFYVFDGTSLT
ncbi:MAG TPA: hypothetical protein VLI40_00565, partial [Gemmatimonadaceae bacterium]|nr:hypothetical protein [Gemmatimonadaceae bacterium]